MDPYNPTNSGLIALLLRGANQAPSLQAGPSKGIEQLLSKAPPSENVLDLRDPTASILDEFTHKYDPPPQFPPANPGALGQQAGVDDLNRLLGKDQSRVPYQDPTSVAPVFPHGQIPGGIPPFPSQFQR